MGRILSLDFGQKRTGLAVTDPLQIIATALDTIESAALIGFLKNYFQKETVDEVIIGMPRRLDNTPSENAARVKQFIEIFKKNFPQMPIHEVDERFTSSLALDAMLSGGMKKKNRQIKGNVDKISAVLLLQNYLLDKSTPRTGERT
ncbi:MAG: Holliday junction resolvase RuvX [Bacteroidetes bacterium]|nr:Holliday junction resolvase RuvX [Bacteroidota bacterium]